MVICNGESVLTYVAKYTAVTRSQYLISNDGEGRSKGGQLPYTPKGEQLSYKEFLTNFDIEKTEEIQQLNRIKQVVLNDTVHSDEDKRSKQWRWTIYDDWEWTISTPYDFMTRS